MKEGGSKQVPCLPPDPAHKARNDIHVSPRQREILILVTAGLSSKEIALQLQISPRTVETHLQRLYQEYGFRKRSALIAAWLRAEDASRKSLE